MRTEVKGAKWKNESYFVFYFSTKEEAENFILLFEKSDVESINKWGPTLRSRLTDQYKGEDFEYSIMIFQDWAMNMIMDLLIGRVEEQTKIVKEFKQILEEPADSTNGIST